MDYKILTLLICILITSCGGQRAFHEYARAGDTIAIPVGMKASFNKDNIAINITPSVGAPIILGATDPSIRAVINLYPDPISNMIVSREINTDITPFASTYGHQTLLRANNDKDYYETTVFLDLPSSLPVGLTNIEVSDGTISHNSTLDVIEGNGSANTFDSDIDGTSSGFSLTDIMLDTLSRSSHTEVSFTSSTLPHAIEISFTHDPDETLGGAGKTFVVNPLGYRKNLSWSDDGTNLKIIMMESQTGLVDDINDFKFYIAGTATNLQLQSVSSYDINGDLLVGTNASLTMY